MNEPRHLTAGQRVARGAALFLAASAPVWVASVLLWSYDGPSNLWGLKNQIELLAVALVAGGFTAWSMFAPAPARTKFVTVSIFLASVAFVLGGFKVANDYSDVPDLLLGLAAQLVGFLYLLQVFPVESGPAR
jgi:hypothetical protein